MRIAIDARLNAYRQGGIPQYTRQLVTALADVATEDQIVSFQHRDQLRPLAIAPNVVRRTALTPPHHRFEQWTLPLEVLLARPDVLHCPDFIAPTRRFCPAVVTIHDLAFMHYPEILDASARAYYSQVTSNAPRADAIIAVSESTRQDIAQFLDIPIEQIDVIYEAAAPLYTRLDLREGEARVLNSTPVAADTFMLFVSTLEPRKNLPTLLQALRICLDRRPDAGYRLVIVGRRGWRDEAIFQTARDLKLADHVLFTGNVGQYDLRWLYNACRLYINPSLYEGFGLPLLEAMACGAPCLAAATSSLPEIGGDAAIYVPPLEAEQWADEIMALWDDEDRRAELGRMGVARAQQFSWNRAARETLKVYRRAVERIVPRAEPHPAPRYSQQPELLPANAMTALGPDASRPCLRCGTALLPGDLQLGVSMRAVDSEHPGRATAPRVWSCPRCGYVELVDETHLSVHHEHATDTVEQLAQVSATEDAPVASATPIDVASQEAFVAPEDEAVAASEDEVVVSAAQDAVTSSDESVTMADEPVEELVASEDAPLDAPVALANEAVEEPAAREDVPVEEPAASEDEPVDEPAASEDEPVDEPAASEDEPVVPATPVKLESPDASAAQDTLLDEPAELESRAVASADGCDAVIDAIAEPEQAQAELAGADMPDTPLQSYSTDKHHSDQTIAAPEAPSAHASNSSNGTVIKPRSGRGSRRQPPSAEPTVKPAAKRRSGGSKRKQTT